MKKLNILSFIIISFLTLSFVSALPSYTFITPLNNALITDNSFTLINLSVNGYEEVSILEEGSISLLFNEGDEYWYYPDWILVNGLNTVPLEFCTSLGVCDYVNLTFYNMPISFISPSSLTNSLFVDINISAPGFSDGSFMDGSLLTQNGNYWSEVHYEAIEGFNEINFSFWLNGTKIIKKLTFTVDTTLPVITVIGGDETLTVGDAYTDKGAIADDAVVGGNTTNLTLRINNVSNVNTGVPGTYLVLYNVTDDAGNTAFANRTVIVNPAVASPSTTGNGGGGGGYCITKWTCNDWSACSSSGLQTRTCTYPVTYCKPTDAKPSESQACTYVAPTVNNGETEETEENTQGGVAGFINGITGAVIGGGTGSVIAVVLLILIVAGLVYWLFILRKKKNNKN